jgi:GNAT superfamily N-acetyltransferase
LRALLRIGFAAGVRGSRAARIIASHAPAQPFTYLRTLGVDPEWQGHGLGSRLVEWVIRTAPTALPVYLETAKEENLAFYMRHGFNCMGQFACLETPVWRLLRPPAEAIDARLS